LNDFNRVVDNGAERIFTAWEAETNHLHKLETRDLSLVGWDALMGKAPGISLRRTGNGLCAFAIVYCSG
jgi:uncharacterized membrane protein